MSYPNSQSGRQKWPTLKTIFSIIPFTYFGERRESREKERERRKLSHSTNASWALVWKAGTPQAQFKQPVDGSNDERDRHWNEASALSGWDSRETSGQGGNLKLSTNLQYPESQANHTFLGACLQPSGRSKEGTLLKRILMSKLRMLVNRRKRFPPSYTRRHMILLSNLTASKFT